MADQELAAAVDEVFTAATKKKRKREESKIVRLLLALILVAGISGAIVAVGATPAAASWSDCPANKFCTYWNTGGGNPLYYYSVAPLYTCVGIGYPWTNQISSVYNRTGYSVRLYADSGCFVGGVQFVVHPGEAFSFSGLYNDNWASFKWTV